MNTTYYVWRRSDGYVAASTYTPIDYVSASGTEWSYELLTETDDWPTARDLIERERGTK